MTHAALDQVTTLAVSTLSAKTLKELGWDKLGWDAGRLPDRGACNTLESWWTTNLREQARRDRKQALDGDAGSMYL